MKLSHFIMALTLAYAGPSFTQNTSNRSTKVDTSRTFPIFRMSRYTCNDIFLKEARKRKVNLNKKNIVTNTEVMSLEIEIEAQFKPKFSKLLSLKNELQAYEDTLTKSMTEKGLQSAVSEFESNGSYTRVQQIQEEITKLQPEVANERLDENTKSMTYRDLKKHPVLFKKLSELYSKMGDNIENNLDCNLWHWRDRANVLCNKSFVHERTAHDRNVSEDTHFISYGTGKNKFMPFVRGGRLVKYIYYDSELNENISVILNKDCSVDKVEVSKHSSQTLNKENCQQAYNKLISRSSQDSFNPEFTKKCVHLAAILDLNLKQEVPQKGFSPNPKPPSLNTTR